MTALPVTHAAADAVSVPGPAASPTPGQSPHPYADAVYRCLATTALLQQCSLEQQRTLKAAAATKAARGEFPPLLPSFGPSARLEPSLAAMAAQETTDPAADAARPRDPGAAPAPAPST
ncbi:hypothetical protein GGI02_003126, partial [Coemansia sp. RSA 2322]